MSIKGNIEIMVHFSSFRNIDLYHQGVYQLRTAIYQPNNVAQPYIVEGEKREQQKDKEYILCNNNQQDIYYYSKAFLIKYQEQNIDLNEYCVFRLEINAFPQLDSENVKIQVELLFCENSVITREDFKPEKLSTYMKQVAKFQGLLSNITMIHQFVPITFDEQHFCLVKTTIHSILTDFKYHQTQETFEQFMKGITKDFQLELINEFNQGYTKQLIILLEGIQQYYRRIVRECISDKIVNEKYSKIDLRNYNQKQEIQTDNISQILLVIKGISSQIFIVWYQFLEAYKFLQKLLGQQLEFEYNLQIKDRWGESIFQNVLTVDDLAMGEKELGKNNKQVAKQVRNQNHYQQLEPIQVQDLDLFPEAKAHPIVFKEISIKSQQPKKNYKGLHLIVFVHGYQGNSRDLRLWKNNIAIRYPDHLLLSSSCNEENTGEDIMEMGKKFANEVLRWISEWCPKDHFSKLSFVGHSLGGLIIRAALPHLSKYKEKFYSYFSLGTPHLGYTANSSTVVNTGLWFIRKWKKCKCLNQLTLNDNPKYELTTLFRLSQTEGLGWFKNLILVSSYQDTYIPYESARIQRLQKNQQNSERTKCFNEMIHNIMQQLNDKEVDRLDINYEMQGKNLDTMIGRAAHIAFLDNSPLIKLMVYSFDEWLE